MPSVRRYLGLEWFKLVSILKSKATSFSANVIAQASLNLGFKDPDVPETWVFQVDLHLVTKSPEVLGACTIQVSLFVWCQKTRGILVVRADISLTAGILRVFGALIDQVNFDVE